MYICIEMELLKRSLWKYNKGLQIEVCTFENTFLCSLT